jgi:hypothetical protein
MAKVNGPLYSMGASGKLGDAMVFFGWKGINVVRNYVIPTNKMSASQGNNRTVLGGTGRSVAEIKPAKAFAQQLIDLGLIPGGQTKQSYLVKYIIDHYLFSVSAYTAQLSACTGHTRYDAFQAAADTLGVVAFGLDYDTVPDYDKALGLYLIAKAAGALGFTGTPYTLALASWVTASVDSMISDFTNA